MLIGELLDGITVIKAKTDERLDIKKIASDSRKCQDEYAFVALRGTKRNGNKYIKDALNRGCCCIITDDENSYYEYDNTVLVSDARIAISVMWSNYYLNPSKHLKVIGITGTNGKTSTAHFLYSILKESGKRVGLISTVKCIVNEKIYEINGGGETLDIASAMTTPDPEILYKILHEMKEAMVEYVVMEVSSHALELSKVYPIIFEAGIFTNLSAEHLDFHKTMDNYFSAKAKLFCRCRYAIINGDDPYALKLHKYVNRNFVRYGYSDKCSYKISNQRAYDTGCTYLISCNDLEMNISTKICGDFSVYNSAAAATTASELGIKTEKIIKGIEKVEKIEGRMEKISEGIYIDYAHTPDAMKRVIESVRSINRDKKITVIFGCGGDRDKSKRKIMGEVASKLSDAVIITSDNSRTENTMSIIRDIIGGVKKGLSCFIVPNRKDAIELGVQIRENGVLLILGKGHEKYEICKTEKKFFDEKAIVNEAIYKYDRVI